MLNNMALRKNAAEFFLLAIAWESPFFDPNQHMDQI